MDPINLLGLTIYPYGLAVSVAAVIALCWSSRRGKKAGLKEDALSWFALLAVPMGFLFARLGFVLCEYEYFLSDGIAFFFEGLVSFTSGGYMLYGTLLGCSLAALIAARLSGESFGRLADTLAAPAALMIALCRLAEGLAGIGYGWGLENWFTAGEGYSVFSLENPDFFCRFPFAVSDYYGEWKWAVFALMSVLMLVLCIAVAKVGVSRSGGRFTLLLLCYASVQILGESLRQDAILKWGFVRVNQILGAIVIVGLIIHFWRASGCSIPQLLRTLLLTVACVLVVIAMEFAMEGKISAIEWMPMDVCYLFTSLACFGMIASILPLWRLAYGKRSQGK